MSLEARFGLFRLDRGSNHDHVFINWLLCRLKLREQSQPSAACYRLRQSVWRQNLVDGAQRSGEILSRQQLGDVRLPPETVRRRRRPLEALQAVVGLQVFQVLVQIDFVYSFISKERVYRGFRIEI